MNQIPKRRKPSRMAHKERTVVRSASHLQWVRGHVCATYAAVDVPLPECFGKVEAAHVRIGGDGGTGMKPGDDQTIPLCQGHHAEQHRIGERSFEAKYKIQMKEIAGALWLSSPHGKRYRAHKEM